MKSKKAFAKHNRQESELKRRIKKVRPTTKKWDKKKYFEYMEDF